MLVGQFVRQATVQIRKVVETGEPLNIKHHRNRKDYATVVPTELWQEARQALQEKRARQEAAA